jgi:hypothetical protein
MSILTELTTLFGELDVLVETGVFSDTAPDEYVVITPFSDIFELHCDNQPEYETQEARLSLFTFGNYVELKNKIVKALLKAEYTITGRQYMGHEDDTKYHHYSVDVSKIYELED